MSYNTTSTRLSICLRTNGFSFSLIGPNRTLLAFGDETMDFSIPLGRLTESIKFFFHNQGIDTLGVSNMRLVVPSQNYVWIPEPLFEVSQKRKYLELVTEPSQLQDDIYHVYNADLHAFHLFSAPANVVTAFKLALPGIDVHSQHSIMVNGDLMRRSASHPLMMLIVDSNRVDVESFFAGQLLLSSSCRTASVEDAVYYALGVMKQLRLETPDMELSICGDVDRGLFAQMQRFFPNVSLYAGAPVLSKDTSAPPVPTYKYPFLFN